MRKRMVGQLLFVIAVLVVGASVAALAGDEHAHTMVGSGGEITWGPAPPALPPGAKMAVLHGDPGGTGPFVLRAWMPDGYKVPPHWHPTGEYLTVLSGSLHAGMGDKLDPAVAKTLTAGGFAAMEANMHHWVYAEGETVIQVHGTGPFAITYVNAADDPRTAAK